MNRLNLKNIEIAMYDYGIFTYIAEELAKYAKKFNLYTPWKGSFPMPEKAMIGEGLLNVNNVYHFFETLKGMDKKKDIIIFPDCNDGDIGAMLAREGWENVFSFRMA